MNLVRSGILAIFILTVAITVIVYPDLPDLIPSHWNFDGEVDGYLPRFWGVAVIPLVMAACTALFFVLPRIDPLRANYPKFRAYYEGFILVFAAFLFVIQLQVLLWGLGFLISPNVLLPPVFGIVFIYLGFLVERAEQNWFVGIRTPWTLSSASVWKKTHERGGLLFKIAGVIAMAGAFAGQYALWFAIVPILIISVYMVIYSYVEYGKEQRMEG
jgi:uncharacterized membrane protein